MLGRKKTGAYFEVIHGFQNLIGMLGSMFTVWEIKQLFFVSKPYRYARKCVCMGKRLKRDIVSKPYRYARKL